jgi:PAS domain S-box-containing protein
MVGFIMIVFQNFFFNYGDFIIFSLCIFVLFYFLIKSLKKNFSTSLSIPIILIFSFLFIIAFPIAEFSSQREKKQVKKMLRGFAPTYAIEFQKLGHEKLGISSDPKDPLYLDLIQTEIEWQKANPAIADVYTIKKKEDGSIYFMVDSETDYNHNGIYDGDKEQRTAIGESYTMSEEMTKAFEGISVFDHIVNVDRWGAWVSGYAPILNKAGKVDGVVGVDYKAEDYLRSSQMNRVFILGIFFFLILLFGAYIWIISEMKWNMKKREEAQKTIKEGEARLQMALKASLQGIFEWNDLKQTLYFSESFYTMLGHESSDFPMTIESWEKLTHPDDIEYGWRKIQLLISTNNRDTCVFRMQHKNNHWRWVEVKFYVVEKDKQDKAILIVGFISDITEIKELQQQMIHSEKLATVGTLAAGIAHEINNPLFIIKGLVAMLYKKLGTAPEFTEHIGILKKADGAIDRIVEIVRGLRVYARSDSEAKEIVDFHQILGDTLSLVKNIFEKEGIKISIHLQSKKYQIMGNSGKFQQVIMNILVNAKDAFKDTQDKKIILTTEDRENNFILSIEDNGSGIDETNLPHIFDPFFTTKDPGKGTGLGLAICRSLIVSFKGNISVKSRIGLGTTFTITLPNN